MHILATHRIILPCVDHENPYDLLSSTEYVTVNGNVLPGPDLPWVQFLNPLKLLNMEKNELFKETHCRRPCSYMEYKVRIISTKEKSKQSSFAAGGLSNLYRGLP